MGCIARLGCLVVLLVGGIVAYFTRDTWMPQRFRPVAPATATATTWEPMDAQGAQRTRAALARLGDKSGPAFQTIAVSDLAGFAIMEFSRQLPGTAVDSMATRTSGDTVFIRANVRTADLGGSALGPLGKMLGSRETVQLAGTVHVIEPGTAELQIHSARIRNLPIPSGMIPDLVRRVAPRRRPGMAENAIDLPVPKSLGDVRVSRGKATLYKSGQ